MFGNLKAEVWWLCRTALQRTHEHVLFLEGKGAARNTRSPTSWPCPAATRERRALPAALPREVGQERAGKIVIEKKDALARRGIASPDHADALMLTRAAERRISAGPRRRLIPEAKTDVVYIPGLAEYAASAPARPS
jgi:hypothetical protein